MEHEKPQLSSYVNILSILGVTMITYLPMLTGNPEHIKEFPISKVFYPIWMAIGTSGLYLLSLSFFKAYNWIITVVGSGAVMYVALLLYKSLY